MSPFTEDFHYLNNKKIRSYLYASAVNSFSLARLASGSHEGKREENEHQPAGKHRHGSPNKHTQTNWHLLIVHQNQRID